MSSKINPPASTGGEIPTRSRRTWPVRAVGWMLLFQTVMFGLLAALLMHAIQFEWGFTQEEFLENLPFGLRGLAFLVLAVLSLLAALGFFRLWPSAWFNALLVQGSSLLLGLILYFRERPFYSFLVMLFGVWMVVYLNYSEVRAAFSSERQTKDWGGVDQA